MPDPTPPARRATDEEVARLREDRWPCVAQAARRCHCPCHRDMPHLLARLDAAEAERDAALAREARLAEALRGVLPFVAIDLDEQSWRGHDTAKDAAKAALAEHDTRRAEEGA
jgi:hypothetical protein